MKAHNLSHASIGVFDSGVGGLSVLREIRKSSVSISYSIREGFNIAALEACQLGVPTFVKLVCFKHENLHHLDEQSISLIEECLTLPSRIESPPDILFSWDSIADMTNEILMAMN